eukprot:357079-Chlamydomonas_euryale.AAC.1
MAKLVWRRGGGLGERRHAATWIVVVKLRLHTGKRGGGGGGESGGRGEGGKCDVFHKQASWAVGRSCPDIHLFLSARRQRCVASPAAASRWN